MSAARRAFSTMLLAGLWALAPHGFTAETADPIEMTKTVMTVTVDSDEPLDIRTSFQDRPPAITLTFPKRRVVGSLPERSTVAKGVIQSIVARYDRSFFRPGARSQRFLQALQIELSAPYAYRVRPEPGRVVVEIDHPASVSSASVEVGLRGGTVIGGIGRNVVSQRFQAMQEALAQATPTLWTFQLDPEVPDSPGAAARATSVPPGSSAIPREADPSARQAQADAPPEPRASTPSRSRPWTSQPSWWALLILAVAVAAAMGSWWFSRGRPFAVLARSGPPPAGSARLAAGIVLIDQLIWRAFERQGYQFVLETALADPAPGTLRVMMKDGVKSALLFIGQGPFFEKQTVERVADTMQAFGAEQGFLAAAGSFTVPAQRVAAQRRVTLIGREQLTELLSLGAGSEYFTKQLEQSHARLEEAKETLRQYAQEVDTLRRQRNEASWYLGEEREKTARLETQLHEVNQQMRHHEAEIHRWEQEAARLRRQWEESQWYLGEAVARVRHLESQLGRLQEMAARAESAERGQETLQSDLAKERERSRALEEPLAVLQRNLEESAKRELALQLALDQLKEEFRSLRVSGERRSAARADIPRTSVELHNGDEQPMFSGAPHDVSRTGVGLQTDQELPVRASIRIRLNLPGREPIESKGRVVWQRAEGVPLRYRSGCRLLRVSAATRALIGKLVEESLSPNATG